jgi:peptidoglycan biosynthesis protein MviN/MurJ (putative lipid II flippase)
LESKLLGGKGDEHIEESIRLVMMFALPMTAGLVVLALPIAYVFGRNYSPAAVPLQLLSLASFLSIIYGISLTILQGAERVDTQVGVSSGDIIRSSLAMPRVIETVARALCVLASLVVLSLVRTWDPSSEASVTILALMNLLVTLALSLSMLRMSRRTHGYVVPWRDLSRYALATIVMTVALLGLYPVGAISDRIFDVLVNLLPVVVAGGIVYFTVLLAIDQRLRNELREVGNVWRARRKSQRQKDLHPAESER